MHADAFSGSGVPPSDHLATERLAALADEKPSPAEAHHLSVCAACAGEVEAYLALVAMARSERDRLGVPLVDWTTLASALERDGLIDGAHTGSRAGPGRRHRISSALRQATAAALLLAAGLAIGRLSATRSFPFASNTANKSQENTDSNATLVRLSSDTTRFTSRREALNALAQAEARYGRAVAYLMERDTSALTEGAAGYLTRLAALNQVEQTTRAALAEAPSDPVLSQWYISTVGARQATLQQLGQVVPVDEKRHRY